MFDDEDERTVMMPTFSEGSFFADRYRIDRVLGTGAMGRVYAATELHSGRAVAIKALHKERLGEPETVARFKREAEVLASIGHPCIVEVYTFHHTSDGTPYLAMELLEGVTLKTRLQNAGRFENPRDFQEVLDGIAGALDAAHARGVVHRDLKPDNVFLLATGEPRAKLVDFGLSRIAKSDKELTHSGMILGTPRYMAPEQIRDAASAGPSVDVYSLGILVYESLTGQSPYPAQDYGQLLGCVMEGRITPLEQVRPELMAIAPVVRRAMHPDPAQRFASSGELADAYGAAIGSPSRRQQLEARHSPTPDAPKRKRVPSIPINKGSTLAFDVGAVGGQLPELPSAATAEPEPLSPPPPVWEAEAPGAQAFEDGLPTEAQKGPLGVDPAEGFDEYEPTVHLPDTGEPPSGPALFGGVERTEPLPGGSGPGASQPGAPAAPPASSTQAPSTQAPSTQAQGGDTMYLPNAASLSAPSSAAPGWGGASPAPSFASQSAPAPSFQASSPISQPGPAPKKKRGCGVVAFLVALVLVIAVSAAGGLALRAYTRGELALPFDVPGLAPPAE